MFTKEQLKAISSDEVLGWEVSKVEAGLKALDITINRNWSKSQKAYELAQAIKEMKPVKKDESLITGQDSNLMMLQIFQKMQEQMASMFKNSYD